VKKKITSTKHNNVVLGFLVEQAVISSIATGLLTFRGKTYQFSNNVVLFEKGDERKSFPEEKDTLLLPTAFNYLHVSMVIGLTDHPKSLRVEVQVTLQDYSVHEQATTKFINTKVCQN
jgi:hypothetical protein